MKYALIGCGRIAANHIKAAVNNNLEIKCICDVIPERMDNLLLKCNLSHRKDIIKYTDYKKMLEDWDLEVVSISTESGLHAEIALYCINQGLHVIIEKPMAMNMKDADEIIRLSQKEGIKVSVCHQNRFNIAVQELRIALDNGRFGKLSHGSVNIRWNRTNDYYKQALWRGTWAQDGGALMNQCIHGIDLLRWTMGGDIDEVYGQIRRQFHPYLETEDVGVAIIKFKNGAIATVEGTTNVYPRNLEETLYIFGEKGTVKIGGTSVNNIDVWDFLDKTEADTKSRGIKEETSNIYGNGHTSLFADMIDAICNNREPYVNAAAGRDALELVLAIYKSHQEGHAVKLPLRDFSSIDMKGAF